MRRLHDAEKERDLLIKRAQTEEENIQNNLKKRLRKVAREKVELQNKLEREQEYITHKLARQLKNAIREKDGLNRKLEEEHRAAVKLASRIGEEEKLLKQTIQEKVRRLQEEKSSVESLGQAEIELMVNKMSITLEKLTSDKR